MKLNISLLILLLHICFSATAQERYSRVKIDLNDRNIAEIAKLGLEADHGIYLKGQYLINDFSLSEIKILEKNKFRFEILVADVEKYYEEQKENSSRIGEENCNLKTLKNTHRKPLNFKLGSMGGFFTYAETWKELNKMRSMYPGLISAYQPIDTFTTFEGRPIRYLKITKNPKNTSNAKPRMLYTSLHHAREPLSLSQMIYFMWYLLENYGAEPEIAHLLDNTELYFVPIVNPDGYLYNETIRPNGGGMWRKNRRVNADSTIGVDLNRNYGFQWAYDNAGSSPDPISEVYRGTEGFSEPETGAVRFLSQKFNFSSALNYHSFGNYLIYPWSYSDALASPEFLEISEIIAKETNYVVGTSTETVSYQTNGTSDDWMWGEQRCHSMTPEVSREGFWPAKNLIENLCAESLNMNLRSAQIIGAYAQLHAISLPTNIETKEKFIFDVHRIGKKNTQFRISLSPIAGPIQSTAKTTLANLSAFEHKNIEFDIELKQGVLKGTLLKWLVVITDTSNTFFHVDTIKCIFGGTKIIGDSGDKISNWINTGTFGTWSTSSSSFISAPTSLTDSPAGKYLQGCNTVMRTANYISLPANEKISLRFWTKWDIDKGADYANISISEDNFSYSYLCGKFTHPGNYLQIEGEPIYDGTSDWVREEIDLSEYAGKKVLLRFSMVADFSFQKDGIYIDDLEIMSQAANSVSSETIYLDHADFDFDIFPNPASQIIQIASDDLANGQNLELYHCSGIKIRDIILNSKHNSIDISDLASGLYFFRIRTNDQKISKARKFLKI
ncbi:MAG: M14 family zinc carboxypeptidase [Saprospiraceae bacterium]